jgi:hypothetical protein
MKFANLAWAGSHERLANYELARIAEMSESRFSRCLAGRLEFSADERARLAAHFGYPESWLFQQVHPPARIAPRVQQQLANGGEDIIFIAPCDQPAWGRGVISRASNATSATPQNETKAVAPGVD